MVGKRLAHYEVGEKIGEGGMGVVWKATDTSLGREVAIKLLPESFAENAERVARFEREAKVLASLNHPGIAAIYGLHVSEGRRFLAMEYAPGEDLAQRLLRGAVPLDETIEIARGIAEAVEAAHEQGIVHRDLKPANVKVGPDGRVKVLDFGLAKALAPEGAASLGSASSLLPTVTSPATMAGVVLGTAAYMSPEQARGKPIDRRTDVWAFGCVVFELLTGRRAFEGETVSDTLAAVLRAEPEWAHLPAATPPRVRDLIERCLRKDPLRRLRDIGDARVTLAEAIESPAARGADAGDASAVHIARAAADARAAAAAATAQHARARERAAWIVAAIAVLAAAGLALVARPAGRGSGGARGAANTRTISAAITPPTTSSEFVLGGPFAASLALSPDGSMLVYSAADSGGAALLWIQDLRDGSKRSIAGTQWATYPFWSPDGKNIGFQSNGKLQIMSIDGGAILALCDADEMRGASWGADGTILFTPGWRDPIYRVAATGGAPQAVTVLDSARGETTHRLPQVLPDGKHFLYLVGVHGTDLTSGENAIYIGSLDGEPPRLLLRTRAQAILADGHILFLRGRDLVAQRFDLKSLSLSGDPIVLAQGVCMEKGFFQGIFTASAAGGVLAYVLGEDYSPSALVWFDREGRELSRLGGPDDHYEIEFSPDDRSVLLSIGDPSDIWVEDLERHARTRLTQGKMAEGGAHWTPDGNTFVYISDESGLNDLFRMSIDSGEPPARVFNAEEALHPQACTRDGESVIVTRRDGSGGGSGQSDLWSIPLRGERAPARLFDTDADEYAAEISDDGRWLAYTSMLRGEEAVFVARLGGSDERWQVSVGQGAAPRWRADGRELYYVTERDVMAVAIETEPRFRAGTPRKLFSTALRWAPMPFYDVTRDGQRFLVNMDLTSKEPVRLVVGWPEATND